MSSPPEATRQGQSARASIFLADNDAHTERLLSSIAGKLNYQVVVAKDARDAYWKLSSDIDFRVAILDMSTPCTDGVDIVRYMKTDARLMQIPIVIVAGEYGLKLITDCFAAGAIAFLPKPFTTEQLQRTLNMAMTSHPAKISNACAL